MSFCGAVFDFNGTLLWDTGLHNQAWDIFLQKHQLSLTDKQKNEKIHGLNNEVIFPAIFKRELSTREIDRFVSEKEFIYRELCLENGIDFAPGAVDLIKFLNLKRIAVAIATASGKENVDFYIRHLRLDELVDRRLIIYNDGRFRSKPDPDIFLTTIKLMGLNSDEVVIFEDSLAGIEAAARAKPGKVIIVNSTNGNYSHFDYDVITSFNQVDRDIFN
jgi:beta-phosphoglucomutase